MKIPKKVEKAIEYIASYCNKHYQCEECPLHTNEGCKLTTVYNPCDWDNVSNKEIKDENK